MATVELAYNAENKEFMAHAACQKWVTRQFYGEITPRELSWGLFKCPDYLKVCEDVEKSREREELFVGIDYLQCGIDLSDVVLDKFLADWSSTTSTEETNRIRGWKRSNC